MAVSEGYLEFVLEQLSGFGPVTHKRMFGGVGLYSQNIFFALIADDVLYFKVDGSNQADYEDAGMKPFKPFADKPMLMSYYEVPIEVLEDVDVLKEWAEKAWKIAVESKK